LPTCDFAAGAVRDVGRGCVPIGFSSIRMSDCGTKLPIRDVPALVAIGCKADIAFSKRDP
jgi:hypothetical protein